MNEKELLAVLDMSEDEQWVWCVKNGKAVGKVAGESLADLAFRLRDEVLNSKNLNDDYWDVGINAVANYVTKDQVWKVVSGVDVCNWSLYFAKPIHWIIAALIAKGKDND